MKVLLLLRTFLVGFLRKANTALLEETPKIGRQMVYLEESVKEPGKARIVSTLLLYVKRAL